jgi:hypothetical protein
LIFHLINKRKNVAGRMNRSDCRNECNAGLFVRKGLYAAQALFFVTFWRLSRQVFSREASKRK